ncbi:unnamed protein product [Cuscuta epithymum]|uniref:WRKY domain-containing protein n=1 Tax=Cuscuta epithymum TaxID=186058 RepID=A0AAV0FVY8_9ASTE|nr:unnamed protein product [Cuscuta epithymum]
MDKPESPRVCRKRVVAELMKGKASATELQAVLNRNRLGDDRFNSFAQLTLEIGRSFTQAIFDLTSYGVAPPVYPITAGSADSGNPMQACSDQQNFNSKKARTGRYNKRNSEETWTNISKTMEDGGAWRKYGQKIILKSEYPRCYFRCTHKYVAGCRATKQVQRTHDGMYQSTYYSRHTCNNNEDNNAIITTDHNQRHRRRQKATHNVPRLKVHGTATSDPNHHQQELITLVKKDEETSQSEISGESKSSPAGDHHYHPIKFSNDENLDEDDSKSIWKDLMVSTSGNIFYNNTASRSSSMGGIFSYDLDMESIAGLDPIFPVESDI